MTGVLTHCFRFRPSVRLHLAAWGLLCLCGLSACAPGRQPVPPGTIPAEPSVNSDYRSAGRQLRQALLSKYPESRDPRYRRRIAQIMDRLLSAAGSTQDWTVTILEDDSVMNAAATKGNFVFVWTGMLKSVKSDGELAAVLGHEIAHVLARHVEPDPAEQVNETLAGVAGAAVGAVLAAEGYGAASNIGSSLATASVKGAIVNPYSQKLELEADHIGMFIMAEAGYNPELAVRFWERSAAEGGDGLAFFSTHPSSSKRLSQLKALLPKATARYRESVSQRLER